MMKVDGDFVKQSYNHAEVLKYYIKATKEVGLWESERILIKKYTNNKSDHILDLGCGTGRTTIGLYKLGYHQIIGLDISGAMIKQARLIAKQNKLSINFIKGDARSLPFKTDFFNLTFFSFNGLMQIPLQKNRLRVLQEVKRVLKTGGYFIFTSHDRNVPVANKIFWSNQRSVWQDVKDETELHEFGDLFISMQGRESYLHIPDKEEIIQTIKRSGLKLVSNMWRNEICSENVKVKDFARPCQFWITQK